MKQSEVKELSVAELQEKLGEIKKSYADLKMSHAITPLERKPNSTAFFEKKCS